MKNKLLLYIFLPFVLFSCNHNNKRDQQLTAINPLSYTAVVFCSAKDTAIISTYSGRISKRINGLEKEEVLININDEIYSLQYSGSQNSVIASTLKSGLLFVDASSGKIKKQIKIENGAWLNSIILSDDENYLVGVDSKWKSHIWDLNNNYESLDFSKELPNCYIRHAATSGILFYQTQGKYIKWNSKKEMIEKELAAKGRLVDIDNKSDLLFVNYNEFSKYSSDLDSIVFQKKHPYYIYKYANGDTVHDPYHLKLTTARFAKDKIYTAGLDQSIRVWDKMDGLLIDEWYLHNATISDIDISKNQTQVVSVDLKGKIKFWDIE